MGYFFPALEIFATLNVREDKGMEISPIRKCFDEEEFVESVKNWAKATVERGVAVNFKPRIAHVYQKDLSVSHD